ncbi:MAG: DUF2062 domain-containing protein [Burkholderiales bacterium]
MPRKYFRKYLPSHQSITGNRWIAKFGGLLTHHNLWHLHRRSVAGGVAAGLFAGLIPGPFQILGGTILAIAFRVNLPVAALMTLYTNPVTIVPLYLVAYGIGELLVGSGGAEVIAPPPFSFDIGFRAWMALLVDWTASLGKPLLVGLPVLALGLAAIGYFVVRCGWRLHVAHTWRERGRRRAGQAH